MKKNMCAIFAIVFTICLFGTAESSVLKSDRRIKTLVFSDNEVYGVTARTGFQTAIEFSEDEKIETISLGDPIGWRISPSGRRVFVKPLHKTGVTNLSVFTDKRSYQFELKASHSSSTTSSHAYIVRFFYPDSNFSGSANIDRTRDSLRPISSTAIPIIPEAPFSPSSPIAPNMPGFGNTPFPVAPSSAPAGGFETFNFNYTLTGPQQLSPAKIFDDGKSTFFEFTSPSTSGSKFYIVNPDGTEIPVSTRSQGGNVVVVDRVAGKFSIRRGGELVCVFNEQVTSLPSTQSLSNSGNGF